MRFTTILAICLLLMVQLLSVMDCFGDRSNSASSSWAKLQISPDALCSMPYGDFRLNIYEHLINKNPTTIPRQKKYFYAPLALLDHTSANVQYNNVTKLTKMRFRIEMWNDHVQNAVANYLLQIVGHELKSFQVQIIPFEKVFLASTTTEHLTAYALPTDWFPYQLEKSPWFSLTCFNQEDCEQLRDNMHQEPIEFDHFKLHYSLSWPTLQTKDIIIRFENIATSKMIIKLLKSCGSTGFALVSTEDENQLLSEITRNVITTTFDELEVVSPSSQSNIYITLKDLLVNSTVSISKEYYNLGKPVCWNNVGDNETNKKLIKKTPEENGEDAQNEDEWSEINESTKKGEENLEVDFSDLNIPSDFLVDEILISTNNSSNKKCKDGDECKDKKCVTKLISLSSISLGKLRNRQSTRDVPHVNVRYSTAFLSTFVRFAQFTKLVIIDEWFELKKELNDLKSEHENLKTDHQNLEIKHEVDQLTANTSLLVLNTEYQKLKSDHQNLTKNHQLDRETADAKLSVLNIEYQNLKGEHQKLKMDHQNFTKNYGNDIKTTITKFAAFDHNYQLLKTDHQNLTNNLQNLKNDHQSLLRNRSLDIETANTKLSVLQKQLKDIVTPADISFYASRSSSFGNPGYVSYENIILNNGNGLDRTTGIFTAPKSGTYLFTFHGQMNPQTYQHLELVLNGMQRTKIENSSNTKGNSSFRTSAMSIILPLNSNDKVGINLTSGVVMTSHFSGFLIRGNK